MGNLLVIFHSTAETSGKMYLEWSVEHVRSDHDGLKPALDGDGGRALQTGNPAHHAGDMPSPVFHTSSESLHLRSLAPQALPHHLTRSRPHLPAVQGALIVLLLGPWGLNLV